MWSSLPFIRVLVLVALLLAAAGCTTGVIDGKFDDDSEDTWQADADVAADPVYLPNSLTLAGPDSGKADDGFELTGDDTLRYLDAISEMLVARLLTDAEVELVLELGPDALVPILRGWTHEPGFAGQARDMMSRKLRASGVSEEIDFEAPGRLVSHIVSQNLPWSDVLTADYCIDADGAEGACDSGAPYNAGVLTTRAYLAGNASRFNLGRASRLMKVFACTSYPVDVNLQPYIDKEALIPMFRALSSEEQTVEEAKGAFGNGDACYQCHGQFGPHAQFFVKFDESGLWQGEASGLQDPEGELGRSFEGLMASHMDSPVDAASERSEMFGVGAENLSEAGEVIARSEVFVPCTVRNVIEYTFGMSEAAADEIDHGLLERVADTAAMSGSEVTLSDIVIATFAEPRVILAVLESLPAQE